MRVGVSLWLEQWTFMCLEFAFPQPISVWKAQSRKKKPTYLCTPHKFLKNPCSIIIQSCYFDYKIPQNITISPIVCFHLALKTWLLLDKRASCLLCFNAQVWWKPVAPCLHKQHKTLQRNVRESDQKRYPGVKTRQHTGNKEDVQISISYKSV